MISYIKGELAEVFSDSVVVENNGIGYRIRIPMTMLEVLPEIGGRIKVYTYFQVKDDGMNLYGFPDRGELEVFTLLLGVNGVGPKAALSLLSALRPDELRLAVLTDNPKALKAPGVGGKTAGRIILELKDKMKLEDVFTGGAETEAVVSGGSNILVKDTIEALVSLGYSPIEASRAVKKVELEDGMDVEQLLKASLKKLAFL